jgi:hypothetical protein
MQRLVFGIAFGQLLAVLLVILLQLSLFALFWGMVGYSWNALAGSFRQARASFTEGFASGWRERQC